MVYPSTGLSAAAAQLNATAAQLGAPQGREIDRTLQTLAVHIEELAAAINELDSRLSPVRWQVPPEDPPAFPETGTVMGGQLTQLCRRVDEMQRQVTCLLHGLAI